MPMLFPLALLLGAATYGVFHLFRRGDSTVQPKAMIGSDDPAFASYPPGCTGEPKTRATTTSDGTAWRLTSYRCVGTPYVCYCVAQEAGTGKWIGFLVGKNKKRKFWRGDADSRAELARMCITLGVEL